MHSAKKDVDKENEFIIDSYDYMTSAASAQDCTGLIPANPFLEDSDAYEAIYPYKPPHMAHHKKNSEDF